jgi:Leucine-rich repeat (LRR) protein
MDINNILDQFADNVTEIDISNKKIVGILDFKRFTKLTKLDCSYNKIRSLDNLPNSLIVLDCSYNQIINLDIIPTSLIELRCYYNKITSLDNLRS